MNWTTGGIEREIPGSYYTGHYNKPPSDTPQVLVIYPSDNSLEVVYHALECCDGTTLVTKEPDVLVLTSSYNEATGTETAKVIAKRGSNGEHLWEEPVTGTEGTNIFAFGAGDLDGDKNEDVLVLISTIESEMNTDDFEVPTLPQFPLPIPSATTRTETVIAKRGSDGEHIWTESVSGTAPNLIISAGDLGEDERGDVLVMMTTSELDMATFTINIAARLIAKRGGDGEPLWEEPVDGFCWALPAGDLDGDGKDDVLVQMSSTERDKASGTSTTTATVIAKRGYDGEPLWEEHVTGTELFLFALPAGDLDGDEIADVLLGSHDQVYALRYTEK
jgi:hypothetical protein